MPAVDNLKTVEVRGVAPRRPWVIKPDPALSHPHRMIIVSSLKY